MFGHEADRCTVSKNRHEKCKSANFFNIDINQMTDTCYFIDCLINDEPLRGFVDSGCAAVTIRQSVAQKLKLQSEPTQVRLCGYAGGSVVVKFKTKINLKVDLAFALVEALIVPDHVQEVPIIVGQPFVNNEDVTVLVRGNQIRLFNHKDLPAARINNLCQIK